MTVDQRGSRRHADAVADLLRQLADRPVVRAFERTAGDEAQGLLDDAAQVVDVALLLVRARRWSVGIGVGEVTRPLPESVRAGQGPAYTAARQAVTRAKSRVTRLAVAGPEPQCARAQAALDLVAALLSRRTDRGWEAVDLAAAGVSQVEIGRRLGVSKQAVSQRLMAADWPLEPPGRELAAHLLSEAAGRLSAS